MSREEYAMEQWEAAQMASMDAEYFCPWRESDPSPAEIEEQMEMDTRQAAIIYDIDDVFQQVSSTHHLTQEEIDELPF